MGVKLALVLLSVAVVLGCLWMNKRPDVAESVPVVDEPYWGPGKETPDRNDIVPFRIAVEAEVLVDLKRRLSNRRPLTPSLEGTQQDYGISSNLLEEVVTYWEKTYNWREREELLNRFPQFKTQIQGLDIHFIRVKPSDEKIRTVPLLILHGWPGSVKEFHRILPMLAEKHEGADFAFEVIAASLPGYGFSQAASKPGLGAVEMSVVLKNLMLRLGFDRFYVQGGDLGALIAAHMSTLYPRHVLGMHSNMCVVSSHLKHLLGSVYPTLFMSEKEASRLYPLSNYFYNLLLEFGYSHIQATKPDTVGVGLNDSPSGLAAYVLEKFTTWTNPGWKKLADGGLKNKYTYDDLLDNIMIYWITKSMTTSMRIYAESYSIAQAQLGVHSVPTAVPTACARFNFELMSQPEWMLKDKFTNLVQITDYDFGGHFIAFEEPKALAKDIFSAVRKMEAALGRRKA